MGRTYTIDLYVLKTYDDSVGHVHFFIIYVYAKKLKVYILYFFFKNKMHIIPPYLHTPTSVPHSPFFIFDKLQSNLI